ncbi:WD repeat-containing protein wrap73 [Clonorchis sinensis]|uniref:WD repeat-containing protein wrap73 n=1 Tax=Clonorchis sinensis TaxID=79923 RepID=A0A8T1M6B3_CLOSI|nr:WD repeat-containing protein wrap73 [Clonorchis sinensis]
MNFSVPVKASMGLVSISPDCNYVASASHHRITLRTISAVQVSRTFTCIDVVSQFSWSPDSLFILCVLRKRGTTQILSIENPEWKCRVDEGPIGLLSATWAPDSRHFLTISDFHLRVTVWSLSEVSISYLKYVKACENNLGFSPGGRYLALLERRQFKDHLSLLDCERDWTLVRNIQLDTQDAVGLMWSPDGRFIVIWDECLRYRVAVYTMDLRHIRSYSAYETGQDLLGIKSVCWSPTGELLGIGSYDQKCRILINFNWTCLATLTHPVDKAINPIFGLSPTGGIINVDGDACVDNTEVDGPSYRPHRIDAYEEQRKEDSAGLNISLGGVRKTEQTGVLYCLLHEPFVIQSVRPDPKIPFPKIGIGLIAFSTDGRFLVTRNDNAAHAVWIWSIDHRLSLFSVLIHTSGQVAALAWDPTSPARLALCTGSDCLFMWTPQGCLAVETPAHFNFTVNTLSWLSSGDGILLQSDTHFCICYLEADQESPVTHKPLWRPPRQTTFPSGLNVDLDSSLPVGVFGNCSLLDDSVVDGPKWLRQHNSQGGGRRRSSSFQPTASGSQEPIPCRQPDTRATSVSSSSGRQAWLPTECPAPKPMNLDR